MKIIKFLRSRMFVTGVLIAVQLLWMAVFWLTMMEYSPLISLLFTTLSLLIVLHILVYDDNPSFKIGWIIIIMALPLLGGLLYVFFGGRRPLKNLSSNLAKAHIECVHHLPPNNEAQANLLKINERLASTVSYLQNTCSFPVWENSQTYYYPLGQVMYSEMLIELEKAKNFIFLEYFIIERGVMWDKIYEILKRKAKQGVDIRLIYDDMGCLNLMPKKYYKDLEALGIKCISFNRFVPVVSLAVNNRDHRKIMIIDGSVAFTGGINIADEYINVKVKHGHWKDTGIKITGDAVWSFTVMFLEMWNAFCKTGEDFALFKHQKEKVIQSDGFVLPFGDSPLDEEPVSQNLYIDILNQAKHYVYIFTPYLIIDYEMQNALRFAAKRGVDVKIVTPGIPDKKIVYRMTRSYYPNLLSAGVKIYEYTPGFLHAKSYVCDDEIAVVGTINMDFRSLYLHFECGVYLYKTKSVLQLKDDFTETLDKCREVKANSLKQGLLWYLFDAVIRAFAPLM